MAKTKQTIELEKLLWFNTRKMGLFACFEVTIGIKGNERVDFLTWETSGVWRAYEIKVTKADFRSNAAKSFVGHYNYYVMPAALYEQVKNEIPKGIGVRTEGGIIKPAKRQELTVSHEVLMTSMMRSMYRDSEQYVTADMRLTPMDEWKKQKQRVAIQEKIKRLRSEIRNLRSWRDSRHINNFADLEQRRDRIRYWEARAKRAEAEMHDKRS